MTQQHMDVVGSLRKIAKEILDIVNMEQQEDRTVAIGGASFMLNWIADGLDRELQFAAERAKRLQRLEIEGRKIYGETR